MAINAVHVESIHRISLALLIFVAGLGTNLRRIRGGLATAASLCLLVPLLMWLCLSAGFLNVGVPMAVAALAGSCLLANDSAALGDLLEAGGRPLAGRLRHCLLLHLCWLNPWLCMVRLLGVPLLLGMGSALPLKDRRLVAAPSGQPVCGHR